jgi:colanic acid/amylovoran biosynthesis glycosyltransferase
VKIFYVTATFPYGAGEEFLAAEIDALSQSVESLLVVPLHPRGNLKDTWLETESVRSKGKKLFSADVLAGFLAYLALKPLRVLRAIAFLLRHSRPNKKFIKNLTVIPKAAWLARMASKNDISHIHVHWGGTTSSMVMLSCLMSGVPWSLTCHRWDIYENNLLAVKSKAGKFIRFISRRGAKDSLQYGVAEEKISVIPMGVAVEGSPPVRTFEGEFLRVMCAANLIEVKGHKYLLKALSILKEDGLKVRLSIAGVGPLFESLRHMVVDLNLAEEVNFLGQIAHSELMEMYRLGSVDLFVLPSIELDPVNHEGVPVSLMEAMSFGIPCISTKTGSIQELLTDEFNNTVPQQDAEAIAEKIKLFAEDAEFYTSVSKLGGEVLTAGWTSKNSARMLLEKIGCFDCNKV